MENFRALRVFEQEGEIAAQITPMEIAELCPGEVVIKTEYSSLNYKDALALTGRSRILRSYPLNAGIDVAGEVIESKNTDVAVGSKVIVNGCGLGESHDGGFSEVVRVPGDWIVPLPENMTTLKSMEIGTAGFTAALCIDRMEMNGQDPANGAIVVTGASGGVGSYAVDLLAGKGYRVIAITSKHAMHDYLKDLGATEVWQRSTIPLGKKPLERAEWGGAIDNLGGDMLAWLLRTVQPWGNIASVGLALNHKFDSSVMPFILRGVSVLGISSSNCPMPRRKKVWERLASDLAPRKANEITSQHVSLDALPKLANDMLDGKTSGRVIVDVIGQ